VGRPHEPDSLIGKTAGNFRLSRRIGSGAMGSVYEGVHPIVGIRVAVKVLGRSGPLEQPAVERFFAEARALNELAHENIVKVIDLGIHPEGFYYCVMELLEGETLASLALQGPMDLKRGLFLLTQVAEGLAAAHSQGIIHRDLKPANVMVVRHPITRIEIAKLVDFGIAKSRTRPAQSAASAEGLVVGTPAYMSPEQATAGADIDARSDLYSFGLMSYELLVGHHPFEGRPLEEMLLAQLTETPVLTDTRVAEFERLHVLLTRLLKKKREERFATADEVVSELRAILDEVLTDGPSGPREVTRVISTPGSHVSGASVPAITLDGPAAPATPALPPDIPALPVAASRTGPPQMVPFSIGRATPALGVARSAVSTPIGAPPAPVGAVRGLTPRPLAGGPPMPAAAIAPRARRVSVRRALEVILAMVAVAFIANRVGLIDLQPVIRTVVRATGYGLPDVTTEHPGRPTWDGLTAVFQSAPAIAECQRPLTKLLRDPLPAEPEQLGPALLVNLGALTVLDECLRRHERDIEPSKWQALYIRGLAEYQMALKIDHLPAAAQQFARQFADPSTGGTPFAAELYARLALYRFDDARDGAPEVYKALIDDAKADLAAVARRAEEAQRHEPAGGAGRGLDAGAE
jgi:serine/threonine-protein kinase